MLDGRMDGHGQGPQLPKMMQHTARVSCFFKLEVQQ